MHRLNIITRIKLVVIAFLTVVSLVGMRTGQTATGAQDQPRRPLEFVPVTAPLEGRAGTDDGAAFAIQFIGSTHGSLEPCG